MFLLSCGCLNSIPYWWCHGCHGFAMGAMDVTWLSELHPFLAVPWVALSFPWVPWLSCGCLNYIPSSRCHGCHEFAVGAMAVVWVSELHPFLAVPWVAMGCHGLLCNCGISWSYAIFFFNLLFEIDLCNVCYSP